MHNILTYDDTRDIAIRIVDQVSSTKLIGEDDHSFEVQDYVQDKINDFFGGLDIDEEKGFLVFGGDFVKYRELPIEMDKAYKIVSNDSIIFNGDNDCETLNTLVNSIVKGLFNEGILAMQELDSMNTHNVDILLTITNIVHTEIFKVLKPYYDDKIQVSKVDVSYGENLPNDVQEYFYKVIGDADNLSGIDISKLLEALETHFKWSFEFGLDMTPYIFYKIE